MKLLHIIIAIVMVAAGSARAGEYYNESLSNTPVQVQVNGEIARKVYGYTIINDNPTPVFIKTYDALVGNVTLGTTTQTKATWGVPANGQLIVLADGPLRGNYPNGLTIAAVMSATGDKFNVSTAPTTAVTIQIWYQP